MYQYIDGLVSGAFGHDVFDPSLIHVHGPAVLEDSSCCMKVLGAVQLIGPVKKEVARLVRHRWKKSKEKPVRCDQNTNTIHENQSCRQSGLT